MTAQAAHRTTMLAALGITALLATLDAGAACGSAVIFGQFTAGCGGSYCYVTSPGVGSSASVFGTFWDLGGGNPSAGVGNDNGTYADEGWLMPYGPGFYISGNPGWQTPGVDGCVDPTDSMVAGFSDESADGSMGYFAVACVLRNPAVATQFDFTTIGQDVALMSIPRPVIVANTKVTDTSRDVQFAAPDFAAGFYSDSSPACSLDAVVPSYDVYAHQAPAGSSPPADRDTDTGNWELVGSFPAGQGGVVNLTADCGAIDCTFFLAFAPTYDSGFGTGDGAGPRRVGENSSRVDVGPNLADPKDRRYRIVDRPKTMRPRPRQKR